MVAELANLNFSNLVYRFNQPHFNSAWCNISQTTPRIPKDNQMLLTKSQINKASDKDLDAAAAAIKAEITKRASNSKADLLKKFKKMAADAGVSIDELLGKSAKSDAAPKAVRVKKVSTKVKNKVAPKYRNPANAEQVWTGRGRQPLWVAAALSAGQSMDSLLIK
jgi:DNA-binding protein H-NS